MALDPPHPLQHQQQHQQQQHQRQSSDGIQYYPDPNMAQYHPQHQQQYQQYQHHPQYQLMQTAGSGHPLPLQHHHDPAISHQQPMQQAHMHLLQSYWMKQMHDVENVPQDFKIHHLPLARIKKVMKTDEDVKMISAEAPMIFDKGCEVFITELTIRAWIHAEESKRRTLQRSDIAAAISKTDMFDFLIDIVPREELRLGAKEGKTAVVAQHRASSSSGGSDHRRSQEIFPPTIMAGQPPPLEGYPYPYMLENGSFAMAPGGPGGLDPYQQQHPHLQLQYLQQQQQQQRYDYQQQHHHPQDEGSSSSAPMMPPHSQPESW
ncbi:hypothetical protein BG005_011099 [Podila minutissima]|nr:hypothetical protein BG005_011099 [Podila minutissima]